MSPNVKNVLGIVALAAVVVAVAYGLSAMHPPRPLRSPLETAPEGARVVGRVDAGALRASPIWQAITGGESGPRRIERACGFDPLEQVRDVIVVLMGSEGRPFEHMGFVARGAFDPEALGECVRTVVEADGGGVREVTLDGVAAIASEHGGSRAAFLAPGVVAGGDEAIVRALIAVDRERDPGAGGDAALALAWESVAARGDVVLAAHVPPNWQSFLGRLGAGVDLRGLEGASTLGLGARLTDGLGITVALTTPDADQRELLARRLRERIAAALETPLLGEGEVGATLRSVAIEVAREQVVLTLDVDAERLGTLVALAREATSRAVAARREGAREERRPEPAPSAPAPSAPAPSEPDLRSEPEGDGD